jgi:outer membrane protein assembly factor BamB
VTSGPRAAATVLVLLLLVLASGCTGSGGSSGSSAGPPSPHGSAASASSASPPAAEAGDWPTYHRTVDRAGAVAGGSFGGAALEWRSAAVDGDVYASPLVVGDRAFVATENDTVYAFDLAGGRTLWSRHLGTPVQASALPCGDIEPVSGITGTPVADPSAGVLYVVAFVVPGRHRLFTLSLADGATRAEADADAAAADPLVHQQRAALALGSGRVYVAYGGLFGDCGDYHGQVVGLPALGSSAPGASYRVPSGQAAGIWAPSGPALDADRNLYVTTGNSFSERTFDYGNAVLKLSPSLALEDWFAPSGWAALNEVDGDLGSMGPLPLGEGLVFQAGKSGVGYLLRTSHLGGLGGQAFMAAVCPDGGGVRGGAAWVPPLIYVPCPSGVVGLRVDSSAPSFSVAWRGPAFAAGPPIVAGGAVWSADAGAGVLYALDPASGSRLYQTAVGSMTHFTTPAAADGTVLIAAQRQLVALRVSR